jgi:hypothetical protein
MCDLTFWKWVVDSGILARERIKSLMVIRSGKWIFSSISWGRNRTSLMRSRLHKLSVKIVRSRVGEGSLLSWKRAAQMATSSARLIVFVSFIPAGSIVKVVSEAGQ